MKKNRYVILLLLAVSAMYFFPWFSGNAENAVLASENIIRGTDIKNYTETLADIAGKSMGKGIWLALKVANYLYIFPMLALLSAAVLCVNKKYGYLFSIITLLFHLLFSLAYIFMPGNIKELITLLFTAQPTIYLYGIFSAMGILLSAYGLFTLREEQSILQESSFSKSTKIKKGKIGTKINKKRKTKASKTKTSTKDSSPAPNENTVILPSDFTFDEKTSLKKGKSKKTKKTLARPRKKVSVSKKK